MRMSTLLAELSLTLLVVGCKLGNVPPGQMRKADLRAFEGELDALDQVELQGAKLIHFPLLGSSVY